MTEEIKLSPSAINTYFRSPRLFYYQYVCRLKSPPNIHFYKGNFVHKALEDLFANTRYTNPHTFFTAFMGTWEIPEGILKYLDPKETPEFHYEETEKILKTFANYFEAKIEMILLEGKVRDKNHAWNTIKPKLREHKIFDEQRNIVGIIDSVQTNFDEEVYVIDYKTSKLYKNTISTEYIRQISIYAYLYKKEFGKLPSYIGISYLRYGETYMIPLWVKGIGELIEQQAIDDIEFVRKNSYSRNIEDYPKGNDEFANRDIEYFEKKYPQLST